MTSTRAAKPDKVTTPAWLMRGEVALCPCGCIGKRKKGSFVDKTLGGASNVLGRAMFSDDVAQHRGLLQELDARVKVVTLVGLLIVTALIQHVPVLVVMYGLTLVLAALSELSLGFFVKRVWLFIPIFTGIIVLPATLSLITPGAIVLPLWHWNGHVVGITSQGLTAAGLMVMRVATSVSLVVLFTLTTPWVRLLAALRALFVPRVFILIIGMAYRYIFLLVSSLNDMYTARKARSVGNGADVKEGQRFVAATAGALFGKAHALSEEVHMAMVSRGYDGDAKTLAGFRAGAIDVVFVAMCVLVSLLVVGGDHLLGH